MIQGFTVKKAAVCGGKIKDYGYVVKNGEVDLPLLLSPCAEVSKSLRNVRKGELVVCVHLLGAAAYFCRFCVGLPNLHSL